MIITTTTPADAATGQPLETVVSITFDEDVDPDSVIDSGAFVVTGSTSKLVIEGPGLESFSPDDRTNYLASDVFTGVVEGKVATTDNRTFTFTPKSPLQPNSSYKVLIGTRVVSKTIGTPVPDVENAGTGTIALKGPYTGADDSFLVTINSTGPLGTATFSYRKITTGLDSETIPTDRLIELESGIFILFKSGTYVEGDSFSFDVFAPVPLDEINSFTFFTGSETLVKVSEDTTSYQIKIREIEGVKRIDGVASVDSAEFSLLSITPEDGASNLPLGIGGIVLEFNKDIDPDSVTNAFIEVLMENLPLDETEQMSVGLHITPLVSGKTLTLRFTG